MPDWSVGEGTEKLGSTEPSEQQNDEHHEADDQKKSEESPAQEDGTAEEPPKRQPSIRFPERMAGGQRISEMPESERPG